MVVFKCKMCGGDMQVNPQARLAVCEFCGSTATLPQQADARKAQMFNRANHNRMRNDFDRAMNAYERILEEYGDDPEAYWGIVLCRYGIEYVKDPATGERVPTCHRAQYTPVMEDPDYQKAIEMAEDASRLIYEKEARRIDAIHQHILELSREEKPFDVFICYKETDARGGRTKDSVIAQEVYDALTDKGVRVFFARISLEDKLGAEYESYIFAALQSARIMLVVGNKPEHFEAIWVRNEWTRFLSLMKQDKAKRLIPVYGEMDAYELPEEFAHLQGQDSDKIGFVQDLTRGVLKLLNPDGDKAKAEPEPVQEAAEAPLNDTAATAARLIQNAATYERLGNVDRALSTYQRLVSDFPEHYEGWLGLAKATSRNLMRIDFTGQEYDGNKVLTWLDHAMELAPEEKREGIRVQHDTYAQRLAAHGPQAQDTREPRQARRTAAEQPRQNQAQPQRPPQPDKAPNQQEINAQREGYQRQQRLTDLQTRHTELHRRHHATRSKTRLLSIRHFLWLIAAAGFYYLVQTFIVKPGIQWWPFDFDAVLAQMTRQAVISPSEATPVLLVGMLVLGALLAWTLLCFVCRWIYRAILAFRLHRLNRKMRAV